MVSLGHSSLQRDESQSPAAAGTAGQPVHDADQERPAAEAYQVMAVFVGLISMAILNRGQDY
jgi:hypothetical protein